MVENIEEDIEVLGNPTSVQTSTPSNRPSMLQMYGEVLTDKTYITNPAIAREDEINQLVLALITPDKSAILVGKPGIGKTALVEGLSYRIHEGNVPNAIAAKIITTIIVITSAISDTPLCPFFII